MLLGLNGLRVSEACGTNIEDLAFNRGHPDPPDHGLGEQTQRSTEGLTFADMRPEPAEGAGGGANGSQRSTRTQMATRSRW